MKTPATFDVAAEIARRRLENDRWAPATLLPTEAFSDQPAGETVFRRLCAPDTARGRGAWAVHRRIDLLQVDPVPPGAEHIAVVEGPSRRRSNASTGSPSAGRTESSSERSAPSGSRTAGTRESASAI